MSIQEQKNEVTTITKKILNANLIDPFSEWSRNQLKELGILEIVDDSVYWMGGWINFKQLFKLAFNYKAKGKSNFPVYGSAIVVANHQSELDPFLIGCAINRKVQWVSKRENFDIPIYKSIIKPFGTIPLNRGQSDEEAMEKIRSILDVNKCIGLFPEGTRSEDGSLAPFHTGAARLCIEMGVPYIPVAIKGANKILPKNKNWTYLFMPGNKNVEIQVGKPVYIDSSMELTYKNARFIADQMQQDISTLLTGDFNESRIICEEMMKSTQPLKKNIPKFSSLINMKQEEFNPEVDYSIV